MLLKTGLNNQPLISIEGNDKLEHLKFETKPNYMYNDMYNEEYLPLNKELK